MWNALQDDLLRVASNDSTAPHLGMQDNENMIELVLISDSAEQCARFSVGQYFRKAIREAMGLDKVDYIECRNCGFKNDVSVIRGSASAHMIVCNNTELKPGMRGFEHWRDPPNKCRAHIPINTAPALSISFGGECLDDVADGTTFEELINLFGIADGAKIVVSEMICAPEKGDAEVLHPRFHHVLPKCDAPVLAHLEETGQGVCGPALWSSL